MLDNIVGLVLAHIVGLTLANIVGILLAYKVRLKADLLLRCSHINTYKLI